MGASLTSFSDCLHYTWPWTSVCLTHLEMAGSEAVFTPSVMNWAVCAFSGVLKTTNSIHSLYRHSQAYSFEFLPLHCCLSDSESYNSSYCYGIRLSGFGLCSFQPDHQNIDNLANFPGLVLITEKKAKMILALVSKYRSLSLLALAESNKRTEKSPLGQKRVQSLESKTWLPVWKG